ncbi:MAG: hypothetical protein ACFFCS_12075 [Candidatus Hodarchaeota archaeon]
MGFITGKVIINPDALKTIILYAKRFANDMKPESEWKEVYGFLIGKIVRKDVHVIRAEPMTAGGATEVTFSVEHYGNAAELEDELSRSGEDLFVCGWWHSHPFKNNPQSIFLSDIDVRNHLGFQSSNPRAIALVVDPSKHDSGDYTFGMRVFRLTRTDFTETELLSFIDDLKPDGSLHSNTEEIIYGEVPFIVEDVTPETFVISLTDLFEKLSSGAPPAMAYKEEWNRVEEFVSQADWEPDPETRTKSQVDVGQPIHLEDDSDLPRPILVLGLYSWIFAITSAIVQIILIFLGINLVFGLVGATITLFITFYYILREFRSSIQDKNWERILGSKLDLGGIKIAKAPFICILLVLFSIGWGALGVLVPLIYLIIKKQEKNEE